MQVRVANASRIESEQQLIRPLERSKSQSWIEGISHDGVDSALPGSGTGTSTTSTRKFGPLSTTQPALHVLGMVGVSTSAMIVISTRYSVKIEGIVGSR
jgi:hypothetical protein